ncbi:MAG: FxSxx-COOH system tetratricopeptide repeat protein [Cyanobacteriota bacterium]|nr:FxSxx-COOH system tetratricopeptide repeat protein [Cyanobacteriota bacterium]
MSENTGDKININKNSVGIGAGVNEGNINNSKLPHIINENNQIFNGVFNYSDTGTKGLPRKGEPAEFPNNLNKLSTGAVKFVGRDGDLKILHDQLQEKERASIAAVVTGIAGVGKTELALQYALLSKEKLTYPGGICWIGVRERSVVEQLLEFAQTQLGLFPAEDWTLEQQLDYCWSNWQPAGDVLIILDDVDKYEEIESYLPPQSQRFKLLITTRKDSLLGLLENLCLEVLDEGAALELLETLIDESRVTEQKEEAKQLCKWLGYLPLGLELVGRFLKRRPGWRLAIMIQELEKQALDLPALQKPSGEMTATRGVETVLELSWQKLDKRGKYLGCLLSMFASAPIPWSLVEQCLPTGDSQEEGIMQKWFPTFSRLWSLLVSQKKANLQESSTWENVRENSLLDLNLIQQTAEETYQLHQLVRRYFRGKLEKMEEVEELRSQFCRVMVVEAKKVPEIPVKAEIEKLALSIPHLAETATEMQQWVEDKDLIWPFLSLGRFYQGQGLYELAEPWYKQCLDITRSRLGVEHLNVATSLNNLASLHLSQGRYIEAELLYQEALEMRRQLLDSSHPDVVTSLNNLANLYSFQGQYEEAEPLYQEALEMRKQLLDSSHPDVVSSLNNLAELYRCQGRYKQAEPLYQEALEMRKQLLDSSHPDVVTSLNNLAELYRCQGQYKQAEPLYQEALEMTKRLLGAEHPDVVTSLNNLASLHLSQGQYKQAEPLYQEALEMTKRSLGAEHPDVATSLNNLAELYRCQGRYKEAESLYQEALEMTKRSLGAEHPSIATILNNLANLYCDRGQYTEAESLLLEALGMTKRLLGAEHPDVATILNSLANLYSFQGQYTEAESLYQEALKMRKRLLGAEHPSIATSLNNLALFYKSQRRYKEAEPLFVQALKMRKQLLGSSHPDVATSLNSLASFYKSQERYKEAEPLYKQALEMYKQLLGAEHPDVATSLNNLALFYKSQERYREAEPLFIEALEMTKQLLGEEHPNTKAVQENYLYFLLQVLRENRQEGLSDERSWKIISDIEEWGDEDMKRWGDGEMGK